MRSPVCVLFVVAMVLMTSDVPASERPASPSPQAPATKTAAKPSTVPVVATAPAPAPRQETLEEIVTRVQRRLAMETPRRPVVKSVTTPRPAVSPHVTLVWRPAVVWPAELATPPSSAPSNESGR